MTELLYWLDRHRAKSYAALVVALMALIASSQFLAGTGGLMVWRSASTFVIVIAIAAVATRPWTICLAMVLAVPLLISSWVSDPNVIGANSNAIDVSARLFSVLVVVSLFTFVFRGREISAARFWAAIGGYLTMIWLFAGAYGAVLNHNPQAITGSIDTNAPWAVIACTFYFSTVTQTTLGYGDFVPISNAARALVLLQTLAGVLYLAVAIAGLVGGLVATRLAENEPDQ